jgi:hypothetical protein
MSRIAGMSSTGWSSEQKPINRFPLLSHLVGKTQVHATSMVNIDFLVFFPLSH